MAEIKLTSDSFLERFLGRPSFILPSGQDEQEAFAPRLRATLGARPAFVSAKTDCGDTNAQHNLTAAGFYPADINMTLELPAHRLPAPSPVSRQATGQDREAIASIAGSSFTCSRFHRDPHIPTETAHAFKAAWADNYFEGARGDAMIVGLKEGEVAGFLQLLLQDEIMTIDLIAVAGKARGLGLAAAMLARAKAEYPGYTLVRTGTQAANIASLRFYEKLGFRITGSQAVMHLWKD